jgi:hypothetical protein
MTKTKGTPAMDMAALAVLGLDPKDIEEKVTERIADRILEGFSFDEDGGEFRRDSSFKQKLDKRIADIIDAKIIAISNEHIAPNVSKLIDGLTLQKTNQWGERTGTKVTFIEYLTQRAEAYLTEEVSYDGKVKGQDSYSWSKFGTRLAYMVDQHLAFQIKTAMEAAYQNANATIVGGLKKAMEVSLENIKSNLKVTTEVKSR